MQLATHRSGDAEARRRCRPRAGGAPDGLRPPLTNSENFNELCIEPRRGVLRGGCVAVRQPDVPRGRLRVGGREVKANAGSASMAGEADS